MEQQTSGVFKLLRPMDLLVLKLRQFDSWLCRAMKRRFQNSFEILNLTTAVCVLLKCLQCRQEKATKNCVIKKLQGPWLLSSAKGPWRSGLIMMHTQ